MWFLLALFVATLLFWCLVRASRSFGPAGRLALVAAVSAAGVVIRARIFLPWSADVAMAVQIFLLAGYETQRLDILGRLTWRWVPVLLAVWVVDLHAGGLSLNNRDYHFYPLAVAGALAAALLLMKLSQRIHPRVLAFLGVESLVILAFHTIDVGYFRWNWLSFTKPLYEHWYYLASWRLAYSLLIASIITWIPLLRTAYYWDRWPLRLPWGSAAPPADVDPLQQPSE